jgi:catechol 2,3-dioxygenase-like lactoylglutathione lyase family enzyme
MSVQLNHTIVHARDAEQSARFLSDVLALPAPTRAGPFFAVSTANGVTLDYMRSDAEIEPHHYAFHVTEQEFDAIFARIRERKLAYWADPHKSQPDEINHRGGGRGVYFEDPDGHFLEILTRA